MDVEHEQADQPTLVEDAVPASLKLFVRMWAMAHIIHLTASVGGALVNPLSITTVIAALWLLVRPSGRALAVMAVFQLADYAFHMPWSPDHWALLAFINITILLTMCVRRSTSLVTSAEALPALRAVALISYVYAALAKWNTSFFDVVESCANAIAQRASFGLTEPLNDTGILIWLVVLSETAIPILLAIPVTRRHGVRFALAFHFFLSASPAFAMVDYSAALYALFLLFLSEPDVARIRSFFASIAARSAIARDARRKPPVTAALALAVFGFLGHLSPVAGTAVVWVFCELYLLGIVIATLWTWRESPREVRPFGRVRVSYLPVLTLVVLWGLSPYVGLRTTGVFSMFSGIRTEGDVGNHLFMPTYRVAGWQDDLVHLESSNNPELSHGARLDLAVPLLEIQRRAAQDPELEVTGMLHGVRHVWGPGEGQEAVPAGNAWALKLLLFRPVQVGDQPFCSIS
jgi:hypothetical protein